MLVRKAYKFKLKPTKLQEELLVSFSGHTRFLWNHSLYLNLERLKNFQPIMYYQELDYWSKYWKKSEEFGFLKECPAHILQQKLKDLEKAFKDCFDKKQPNKKLPRFKKKNYDDSFRFPEPKQVKLENRHITFPKLGRVKFYNSNKIIGKIKNYTISRKADSWYVAIQVEQEVKKKQVDSTKAIGLDVGIKHFVSTSKGEQIAPLNMYRKLESQLSIEQRKLKNKVKFSNNWKRQQKKIRKLHGKIRNTRYDFLHKLSTKFSKNHAMIVVEALKVKNMSKSAKGTLESPGKNIKAKSGLNKSILDQGWHEFKRQLKYKLEWQGGIFLEVPPAYTSQKCSRCNYISKENRLTQEGFKCLDCNFELNADINAAKNVLAAGHAVLACGVSA